MIIESLISGAALIIWASLKYTDSIVNGDKRDARKFEAEEAEKDRKAEAAFREKELALLEKEKQKAEEEMYRFDPGMCKAKRLAIAEKRKLILFERDRYVRCYDAMPDPSDITKGWWTKIEDLNLQLMELADEEAKIPVLDGMEDFNEKLQALEKREKEVRDFAATASRNLKQDNNSAKREALERERIVMEKLILNGDYSAEREEARDRLKEITTELGKL
jgi:hypothetical protein